MAISLRAVGASTAAAGAVTGVTAGVPAGLASTDISILVVEAKQATAGTAVTISTPTGWTLIGTVTNNGTNLTAANDTGTTYLAMFYRVGTYTAPTITTTGANSMGAGIVAYQTTAGAWDVTATASGSDATSGANGSITAGSVLAVATGDLLVVGAGLSGDLGTVTAQSVTATGATFGPLAAHVNLGVTTGTDSRLLLSSCPATAGTATAAPIYTWTNTSSLTGHARFLRLREVAPVPTISDAVSAIPDLSARWRADQITGVADAGAVAAWPDASGYSFTATQDNAALQPTYRSAVVNGQPVVRYPAASRWLGSAAPAGSPEQTLIAVIKAADTAAVRTIRGASASGGVQFRTEFPNGAPAILRENQAAIATATIGTDTVSFHSVTASLAASTGAWSFYVDGVAAGSGTAAAQTLTATTTVIGDKEAGTTENFWGDIAELIVFSRVLTSTEVATVDTYIAGRYGIAAAPMLIVKAARSATRASRPLLSQVSSLTVRAARSAARASRALITQQQPTLTVRAARSGTRVGRPLLTQQQGILVRAARSVARTTRPLLTQQQATLTITGSRATTRTSRALLTQQQPTLTVRAARGLTRATRALLTQATSLTVAAARAHTRTGPALLAQDAPLTIPGARATATASHPVLSQHSPLTVRPARAATRAQDARLAAAGQVAVNDTRTQTRASRPTLAQDTPLTVHGARTATRTATATLTSAAPTLTVHGARSQTRAAVAALEQLQLLTVAGARAPTLARRVTLTGTASTGSPDRTHVVPADNRTTSIAPDHRTVSVPPDPRTGHIAAEDRTHTVPAATRILTSA